MKKLLLALLTVSVCLLFASCKNPTVTKQENDKEVSTQLSENNTDDSTSDETSSELPKEDNDTQPQENDKNKVEEPEVIRVGDSISVEDVCDLRLEFVNIVNAVVPPQSSSSGYYKADDGKVYVDFCFMYKNTDIKETSTQSILSGKLIYADKYEYSGFLVAEDDNRTDFSTYKTLDPLSTEYVHYLFEVPNEIQTSSKKIIMQLNVGEKNYTVLAREEGAATDLPVDGEKNTDTSASNVINAQRVSVALNETITTAKCEFYIDYSSITNDVMPPNPSRWYSHYEADDGKVYVDVCFAYKNLSESKVSASDVIGAKLVYADKYNYTGYSTIEEDNRGDFTSYVSISPLSTEYIHYLFEVPEEVASSEESVVINFNISGNAYSYTVR